LAVFDRRLNLVVYLRPDTRVLNQLAEQIKISLPMPFITHVRYYSSSIKLHRT